MSVLKSLPSLLFSLLFATNSISAQPAREVLKWVIEKSSTLQVQGQTNVNKFACSIFSGDKNDTLICFTNTSDVIIFQGIMQMDVLAFNCHNNLKTKELRKTLKADVYPEMSIRFISLQYMPLLQNKTELITGWVEVKLAGTTKRFEICYAFSKFDNGIVKLLGGRSFHFSDFNLSPPEKFGGLVKIRNDFDVNFQLILKPV